MFLHTDPGFETSKDSAYHRGSDDLWNDRQNGGVWSGCGVGSEGGEGLLAESLQVGYPSERKHSIQYVLFNCKILLFWYDNTVRLKNTISQVLFSDSCDLPDPTRPVVIVLCFTALPRLSPFTNQIQANCMILQSSATIPSYVFMSIGFILSFTNMTVVFRRILYCQ